jgi:hypothetical protein
LAELGLEPRSVRDAIADAVAWFQANQFAITSSSGRPS